MTLSRAVHPLHAHDIDSIGTSPALCAGAVPHEDSSLWPYLRVTLDDCDDVVELYFADTSSLSDIDAFERRRQNIRNRVHV